MDDIRNELEHLRNEKESIKHYAEVSFKTKEEGERYIEQNFYKLNRLNEINKRIDELEWELKSPEEQAKILEQRELSRLKREGKLFDEMD